MEMTLSAHSELVTPHGQLLLLHCWTDDCMSTRLCDTDIATSFFLTRSLLSVLSDNLPNSGISYAVMASTQTP
jgi:hypothetical protein